MEPVPFFILIFAIGVLGVLQETNKSSIVVYDCQTKEQLNE